MPEIILKNHIISGDVIEGITYNAPKLIVRDKLVIKDPIKITLKDDNNENLEIVIGKSSEVKFILEVASDDLEPNNYHLKLTAMDNSKVSYLLISDLKSEKAIIHHDFEAKRDSQVELMGGFVSNKLDAKMHAELTGEGAYVGIRAVAVSSYGNIQNIDIELTHAAKYTTGLMHNIAIANGNGKVILNGVEKILQGMIKADAYQNLKGIIASDTAIIEVNPILLIDEHDVKAGHGATVGKLEEHSIYYLMSRGLTRKDAEKLMINGLLTPLIDAITDQPLKERFVELVNERL
ncbi:MAG: SufD family Fe-S cluster assembly protein [Acholeplasmataceae bacterium]|nr:SufD family Fe-S cluster assembly protein [Acholeplasmataceae bacterium]